MKRIQQRGPVDCAVACVAMAIGWTYDDVAFVLEHSELKLDPEEGVGIEDLFKACGYQSTTCEGFYVHEADRPVVLIVPSKGDPTLNHGVVMFDAKLFDPSSHWCRRRCLKATMRVTRYTVYGIRPTS